MPVERLKDGTYRVGNMTFGSAEEAFDHDDKVKAARGEPLPYERPPQPSSSARLAPSKASPPGLSRAAPIALTIIAGVLVVGGLWRFNQSGPAKAPAEAVSKPAQPVTPAPAPNVVAAAPVAPPVPVPAPIVATPTSAWDYKSSTDQMTGKKSAQAIMVSDNELDLDFPYTGSQRGMLIVRRHPQYGLDVIVAIQKGQILCHSYDCKISVKFDDAAPIRIGGTEPADNSSTSVFLDGPERFITLAKKAKRILVQINLFQNGAKVLEFSSPVPLEWPPK